MGNNLETAKAEDQAAADRRGPSQDMLEAIADVRERLDRLERLVRHRPDGTDGGADPGDGARDGRGKRASRGR